MYCADIRTQTDYFINRLEKANNKNMLLLVRSLDGQRVQRQPEFHLADQGCELFSRFFREKSDNLLSGLQCFNDIDRPSDERSFTDCIDVFDRTTSTEITAICCATNKVCMLDPLPENQLTDNITSIVPAITRITNVRGSDAEVAEACNGPTTLKNPSLDKDTLSSYRSVSNLTQLSKVIEKVVALRIMTHACDQHMIECFSVGVSEQSFDRNCAAVCYKCRQNNNGQQTRNHLVSR